MKRVKLDPGHPLPDPTDWDKLRAKPDGEVNAAARADPDAKPLTAAGLGRLLPVPDVRAIRRGLGMTQEQFARAFKLALGTVRDWEQGRSGPDGPARVLLTVIARNPQAVRDALAAGEHATGPGKDRAAKSAA